MTSIADQPPIAASSSEPDSATANGEWDLDRPSKLFLDRVPIGFARRFGVLGLDSENGCLPVAVTASSPRHALAKISVLLGLAPIPIIVDEEKLSAAINRAYRQRDSVVEQVIDDLGVETISAVVEQLDAGSDLLDTDGHSPITRLVNVVLLEAVKRRASDVHVQAFEDHLQVRLRIDGVLYDYVRPPKKQLDEIVSRIKVMGRMNIAEKRLPQDGRTSVLIGDKPVDLRISTLPTSYGERVVVRLLDKSARLYRLAELGMQDRDLNVFRGMIRQSHGIILVTGPTGSGKSTTLYAALQELDSRELNILTLEDPIEYQLTGISQTQVSHKKGMTFASGLRTVLRQDPDVIMVGEIRDQETARMAVQSSLTGHLVFSTLHTNDAAGAVSRLLDLDVEAHLVAGSLLGVLAQRLVRRVCGTCATSEPITSAQREFLGTTGAALNGNVRTAVGCPECHKTGYLDRVGIFELLRVTDEFHDLICAKPKSRDIKSAAVKSGMTTLRQDAVRKLESGVTTIDEVLRVTRED